MALGNRDKSSRSSTPATSAEHRDHRDDGHGSSAVGDGRTERVHHEDRTLERRAEARERFGGINWGAAFFGWLVAVGMTALLAGIVGAVASAVGENANYSVSDASANAATVGLVAAVVLALVLSLAYFAGGYVAGRMSRFDGGKQGAAAWVIGLLITLIAGALGAVAGAEYNILERVNVPNLPLSQAEMNTGGIITAIVVLALTLLAAIGGGAMGRRYHGKVDRVQGL
jgi:hypothetical protein